MKHDRLYPALALLAIGFSTMLLSGCGSDTNGAEPEAVDAPPIPVEATAVRLGDIAAVYEATATLEAENSALVVSKATGVILEMLVEEGDRVQAGDLLARLEQERYQLEVNRARAQLDRLNNALERAEELHARQLISNDEYDRTRFDAQAQQAAYDIARMELDQTEIRAPIDGVITERRSKTGNLVTEHQVVFQIDDFEPLLAVLHVPERILNTLQTGQAVRMHMDALPAMTFSGHVERISPVIDPDTGTFRVTTVIIDHAQQPLLKPGLFGTVQVVYNSHQAVALLDREALISEDGRHSAFVIGADDTVERRLLEIGFSEQGAVEVLSGLNVGDQVVTAGKSSLREGARITVIQS